MGTFQMVPILHVFTCRVMLGAMVLVHMYNCDIIWWYYTIIRNNYTLYNYCIIGKCTHRLHKWFDSCPTHGLHKQFDSCPTHGLCKRFDSGNLVLWFLVFICVHG
jgi:hypothetical protein